MINIPSSRRTYQLAVVAAATSLALTGCGSTGDRAKKVDTAALGVVNQASGESVAIGFISDGKASAYDNTAEYEAADAAVQYANKYLGGLNGRPVKLTICETKGTPAGGKDCANQMIQNKVIGVVNGTTSQIDPIIDVLAAAKLPLVTGIGATQKLTTTPGVFSLGNGLAFFGAPAAYAKQEGYSSGVIVAIDVPSAIGAAQQVGGLTFGNNGVKLGVTGIPAGTADMTPQISAANESKPDFFHLIGDEAFCTSALKAIKTVAPKATVTVIDRCIGSGSGTAVPGGYEGVRVFANIDPNTDTADGKVFAAALAKYADNVVPNADSASGYSAMLAVVRALNAAKITDYTAAGFLASMESAPPVEFPLGDGIKFQCNGKQVAIAPRICTPDTLVGTADKDGVVKTYSLVKAGNTYNPPAS